MEDDKRDSKILLRISRVATQGSRPLVMSFLCITLFALALFSVSQL